MSDDSSSVSSDNEEQHRAAEPVMHSRAEPLRCAVLVQTRAPWPLQPRAQQ